MSTNAGSMIADYLLEKKGIETHFTDEGFVSYYYKQDSLHISELYVKPEHRGSDIITGLVDWVEDLAKEQEFKYITANVQLAEEGVEAALRFLLKNGAKVFPSQPARQLELYKEVQ